MADELLGAALSQQVNAGHYLSVRTPRSVPGGESTIDGSFEALFERTSPRIYGYVRRRCEDVDCDDVVAEVFLVAWRRFGDIPPDPMPWLLATARKVLANHWRGRGRRAQLEAELQALGSLAVSPDPASLAADRSQMLAALATLDRDDRELLLLIGWDGLDAAGAAQVLGCSQTAVRARLSRARRRLQDAVYGVATESTPLAPVRAFVLGEGN